MFSKIGENTYMNCGEEEILMKSQKKSDVNNYQIKVTKRKKLEKNHKLK